MLLLIRHYGINAPQPKSFIVQIELLGAELTFFVFKNKNLKCFLVNSSEH